MALSIKVEPIRRDIELIIADSLSPQARGRAFGAKAREILSEVEDQNRRVLGATPAHTTAIDGRQADDADLDTAQRQVIFEFDLLTDTLSWIATRLVLASPRGPTGRYERSHVLFADGIEVPVDGTPPPAKEYVFLNMQPYARKMEPSSGWATRHGRALSKQAPDGVYEEVAAMARAKFSNVAKVRFTYRELTNDERQPAIVVSLPGSR